MAQLPPGPRVTGGRVSPPGLASTAQAGGERERLSKARILLLVPHRLGLKKQPHRTPLRLRNLQVYVVSESFIFYEK